MLAQRENINLDMIVSLPMSIGCWRSKQAFLSWKYSLSRACENSVCKLLWDFPIVTDTLLCHNHLDHYCYGTNELYLVDIAIPGDSRFSQKAVEKQMKYMDLKTETIRVWKCKKSFIVPISGALGSVYLRTYLYN